MDSSTSGTKKPDELTSQPYPWLANGVIDEALTLFGISNYLIGVSIVWGNLKKKKKFQYRTIFRKF